MNAMTPPKVSRMWFSWVWLSIVACDPAFGPSQAVSAGPYEVEAQLAPDPARPSSNRTRVRVSRDGTLVDRGDVDLELVASQESGAESRVVAQVLDESPGTWVGHFELPVAGNWRLGVRYVADDEVEAWFAFTVGELGLRPISGGLRDRPAGEPEQGGRWVREQALSDDLVAALRNVNNLYNSVRVELASDRAEALSGAAAPLVLALTEQSMDRGASADVSRALERARGAAREVGESASLEDARAAFAELSRNLIALGGADPRVRDGFVVYRCPMVTVFPRWIQEAGLPLGNPHMGLAMQSCGTVSDWVVESSE